MEYTKDIWSPELYRRWAGYCVLSTAVERRVWCHIIGKETFANLYVMLVAAPGAGKTFAIDAAIDIIRESGDTRFAPSGMTKAAFMDHLAERSQVMNYNGSMIRYHHMCIASGELGQLLPDYNIDFLNMLNDIYDCRPNVDERTRMHGHKQVDHPCVTFISGTQPAYLQHILPDTAFGMGFTSRTIMVYAGRDKKRSLRDAIVMPRPLAQKLIHDLKLVRKLVGPMTITEEAFEYYDHWHLERSDFDAPDHPQLENYNDRRARHVQKLAMLNSIARSNDLVIEKEDYETALDLLLKTEDEMPNIFRDMQASDDARHIEEVHRWALKYGAARETIPERAIMSYVSKRVPAHKVSYIMDILYATGRLEFVGSDKHSVGQRDVVAKKPDLD